MISPVLEIQKTIDVMEEIIHHPNIIPCITEIASLCIFELKKGKTIYLCGNGGSAADSQHLAAELVSKLNFDRMGLRACALTTDTSVITAIGNDYGYDKVFSRQIEAMGSDGDVLIAISTSGNSLNVLRAIDAANHIGMHTIGMTGESGGKMDGICDFIIKVPSTETQKIQECHIVLGHILCGMIEEGMFKK